MIPSDTRPTLEDCETACGAISCGCSDAFNAFVAAREYASRSMALLLRFPALVSSPANTCMIPRDTRPTLEDCGGVVGALTCGSSCRRRRRLQQGGNADRERSTSSSAGAPRPAARVAHGLDLDKRIRHRPAQAGDVPTKETAALVGVWRGEAAVHLNLFPETSRAALIATGKLRFHRDRRVGARGSAAPQAQRQSSRGLWAAPLLAEGER